MFQVTNICYIIKIGVIKCAIDYDQKVPTDTLHEFIIKKLSQHPGDAIATVYY